MSDLQIELPLVSTPIEASSRGRPRHLRELVEAGAGCGKTYSLVSRYVEGLGFDPETGAALTAAGFERPPSKVLALTFTEDAAAEMKDRVLARLEEKGLHGLAARVFEEGRISTFHGHCYRTLRPHLALLGYGTESRILPERIVREKRLRYLFSALERYSRNVDVLRLIGALDLCELGCDLWYRFTDREVATDTSLDLERELAQMFEAWQTARARLLDLSAATLAAYPELASGKDNWVRQIRELALAPTRWPELKPNFRTGPAKLREEHRELYELGLQYRDLLKGPGPGVLDPATLAREAAAYREVLAFFRETVPGAPKLLDFAALEQEMLRLLALERNPSSAVRIERPELLLVDEFQDTSPEQMQIIEGLSAPGTEWYFVGDPKQSIYAFRRAEVSLFLELRNRLPTRGLSTNRRSEAGVLDGLNALSEHFLSSRSADDPNAPPPQRLEAHITTCTFDPPTLLKRVSDPARVHAELLADIETNRAAGAALTHGVLFLTWSKLFAFAAHLRRSKVEFEIGGTEKHLDHLLTRIFAEYLHWVADPGYTKGYLSLLRWWRPARFEAPEAALLTHDGRRTHTELFGELGVPQGWQTLLQFFCDLVHPREWRGGASWAASMESLVAELNEIGLHHLYALEDLAHFLERQVGRLDANVDAMLDVTRGGPKSLRLMTVHGSKGLEFDCVYVPEIYRQARRGAGVVDDGETIGLELHLFDEAGRRLPSLYHRKGLRERELREDAEKLRLFYVAITRAKRRLHLYYPAPLKNEAKVDPWALLGLPARRTSYWHALLEQFKSTAAENPELGRALNWIDLDAAPLTEPPAGSPPEALPNAQTDARTDEATEEVWRYPVLAEPRAAERAFFRGGVRRYLETLSTTPGATKTFDPSATRRALPTQDAAALGSLFHQLMERWNGRDEALATLMHGRADSDLLIDAARAVRALPELNTYFATLATEPGRVFREMPLVMSDEIYHLEGVADAYYLDDAGAVTLLDWKTSAHLEGFNDEGKLTTIRRQLLLYSEAFRGFVPSCRALAIGVDLGGRARARVVLDETFY